MSPRASGALFSLCVHKAHRKGWDDETLGTARLLIVGLVGAWQVAASTGALADLLNLESILVPSPTEIAESLWDRTARCWPKTPG